MSRSVIRECPTDEVGDNHARQSECAAHVRDLPRRRMRPATTSSCRAKTRRTSQVSPTCATSPTRCCTSISGCACIATCARSACDLHSAISRAARDARCAYARAPDADRAFRAWPTRRQLALALQILMSENVRATSRLPRPSDLLNTFLATHPKSCDPAQRSADRERVSLFDVRVHPDFIPDRAMFAECVAS